MRRTRIGGLVALVATGALVLSACGSDDNTAPSSAASAAGSAAASATSAAGSAAGSATSAAGSAAGSATSAGGSAASSAGSAGSSAASSASGEPLTFEGAGFACAEGELRSSGSTAQGRVMEQWIADYNELCGAGLLAYGGGGSGKGRQDFVGNQTDFAGSDSSLNDEETAAARDTRCGGNEAINLPMVTGPIAMAYNLAEAPSLILTPEVAAGIFSGAITNWNAPEIAAVNPGATLPDLALQSVHRAEDSGTTNNFTRYLAAAAPEAWTFEPGNAWAAPGGVAAQGSDGMAQQIADTPGSIGYVEWGFAQENELSIAQVDSGAGPVELTEESAGIAIAAAEITGTAPDVSLQIDYATQEPGAYPIVLVTYEIVCSAGNGEKAELIKSFMGYIATTGQETLVDLGAAPLPAEVQARVVESALAIA